MAEHERNTDSVDRVLERSKLLDQVSGSLLGKSSGDARDPVTRANEAVQRLREMGERLKGPPGRQGETSQEPPPDA
jgi:hypothetical protein